MCPDIGEFDATGVEPKQSFDPIPPGKYLAMITSSDVDQTSKAKSGQSQRGTMLKLEWTVVEEGPFKGRKVFDRINLDNDNAQAVEIGQRQLSAICHATGKLRIRQSEELHNIPCRIKVKVRPAEGKYDAGNEVAGYEPASGAAPATSSAAPAAPRQHAPSQPGGTAAAKPAAGGKPPWMK